MTDSLSAGTVVLNTILKLIVFVLILVVAGVFVATLLYLLEVPLDSIFPGLGGGK